MQSSIDALAIAAKAGQVISGFGKVEDALKAMGTKSANDAASWTCPRGVL